MRESGERFQSTMSLAPTYQNMLNEDQEKGAFLKCCTSNCTGNFTSDFKQGRDLFPQPVALCS